MGRRQICNDGEKLMKNKEFKEKAKEFGLSLESFFNVYDTWSHDDANDPNGWPTQEYVDNFYHKTFTTDNTELIKLYKSKPSLFHREYAQGETSIFGDTFEEDKAEMQKLVGKENVFEYTLADGTRVLHASVPVKQTKKKVEKKTEKKEDKKEEKKAEQKPVEQIKDKDKPAPIMPVETTLEAGKNSEGNYVLSVKKEGKTSAQVSEVTRMINGETLPISSRVVLDITNIPGAIQMMRVLGKTPFVFRGNNNYDTKVHQDSLSEEDKEVLKKAKREADEEGYYSFPNYTIGFTDYDIAVKKQREALMQQGHFSEVELREYAKRVVFKISEIVTLLQNNPNAARQLFGNGAQYAMYVEEEVEEDGRKVKRDIDYTSMSRIDIIRKIGLGNIANWFVKESIFNPIRNKQAVRANGGEFIAKMKTLYNNFDALMQMAYDTLIDMEEISLIDGKKVSRDAMMDNEETGELGEKLDKETELEIAEMFGDPVESWQVGFRQVSAFNSLSSLIRNTLGQLRVLDKNGEVVTDKFGMEETVDVADAVAKVLQWTQHATTLEEMIAKLSTHLSSDPWLRQLVGKGKTAYKDGDVVKEGLLVDKEHLQLQSQFFTNFRKYFQQYIVTFVDNKGNTVIRPVNTQAFESETLDNIRTLVQAGNLSIWDEEKKQFTKEYTKLLSILGTPKVYGNARKGIEAAEATGLLKIKEKIEDKTLTDADIIASIDAIKKAYKYLDIPIPDNTQMKMLFTPDAIETFIDTLAYLVSKNIEVSASLAQEKGGTFQLFGKKGETINGKEVPNASSNYKKLISLIAPAMSSANEAVSYEGGKLYYAYVNPGYLGILTDKLKGFTGTKYAHENENYDTFLQREYLRYEGWFYNSGKAKTAGPQGHLNYWLYRLTGEDGAAVRDLLEHVTSLTYEGTIYEDKTDAQYYASLIAMYLYDTHGKYGYFRIPTMSNKQSEEYLKFERIRENYEQVIVDWLAEKTFYQELNRIHAVQERAEKFKSGELNPDAKIAGFDDKGTSFVFLPFLQERMKRNDEFGALLRKIVNKKGFDAENGEAAKFNTLLKEAIRDGIQSKFLEFIEDGEKTGFLKRNADGEIIDTFQIDDLVSKGKSREEVLREWYFNDFFASINILQLTVSDVALYTSTEDLQKRLAQIHSPGQRGNIQALDIATKERITDGYERTFYIKDKKIASDIVDNLRVAYATILKRPEYTTPSGNYTKAGLAMRNKFEALINTFKDPKAINWTDGQGYSSPTSLRKKFHIFGKWNQQQEDAYNRVIKGDFTEEDLEVLWQPLKPFVFSQISKESGAESMPLIKVGMQNKNSEYVLLMADALMKSAGQSSILGVIFDLMEESQKKAPTKGIDTVQFGSTVKTGLTAQIDLESVPLEDLKAHLESLLFTSDGGYNEVYVHTIPFDDYMIQQALDDEHFREEQQMGSQVRVHTIADLPDVGVNGKPNTVVIREESINEKGKLVFNEREITVAEAKKLYYDAVARNVELSRQALEKELALDSPNRKLRNIALSKRLKEEILKDGRFGMDMLWACDVNSEGEFNIPLSDPMQSGRIQQLINSMIKKRINKQEIAGGLVVQVSSYGVKKSNELGIVFKAKDGRYLLTRPQFDAVKSAETPIKKFANEKKYVPAGDYASYEDYVKANQYTFAHLEAYAPIYDERLLDYADENGVIDVKKIERENPKLLELMGLRIPTEAKYSVWPIKIVGFLPRTSGEGIMLPADITLLTGCDFDWDKLDIMRYVYEGKPAKDISKFLSYMVSKENKRRAENDEAKMTKEEEQEFKDKVKKIVDEGAQFTASDDYDVDKEFVKEVNKYWKNRNADATVYTTQVSNERDRNNNIILDVMRAIYTSPWILDQSFSPGNFDEVKRVGYLIAARDNNPNIPIERLEKMSVGELKDLFLASESLLYAQTQVKFHRQNSVAGKLIGVFAQANVSHGVVGLCEDAVMYFGNEKQSKKSLAFTLGGKHLADYVHIDPMYSNDGVTRVTEVLASLLASSVDAVKDPVLNLFNINMTTVNHAIALVRLGYDLETIGWLLTTPIVKELVQRNNDANIDGSEKLEETADKMLEEIQKEHEGLLTFDENYDLARELRERHGQYTDGLDEEAGTLDRFNYQVLTMMNRIGVIADAFRQITHMTRYNSVASGVGPFAANTAVARAQDDGFMSNPIIGRNRNVTINGVRMKVNTFKDSLINNPLVSAFRENSIALEKELIQSNFIQAGPFAQDVFAAAYDRFGYLTNRTAQKLAEFMMSYFVNVNSEIFDLSDGKEEESSRRVDVLIDTPEEVASAKAQYPDNKFLKALRISRDEFGNKTLSLDTKGKSATAIQDIKAGWEQLYKDEEKRLGPDGDWHENLAFKLIEYNFFRGGFGFSAKTFNSLVPAKLKTVLPNYLENLSIDTAIIENDIDRILDQFQLNYGLPNSTGMRKDYAVIPERGEDSLRISIANAKGLKPGIAVIYQDENKKKKRYAVVRPDGEKHLSIQYVDKLGGNSQGFEIDPMRDVESISSIFDMQDAPSKDQEKMPTSDGFEGIPIARIETASNLADFVLALRNRNPEGMKNFSSMTSLSDKMKMIRKEVNTVDDTQAPVVKKVKEILNAAHLDVDDIKLKDIIKELNLCFS